MREPWGDVLLKHERLGISCEKSLIFSCLPLMRKVAKPKVLTEGEKKKKQNIWENLFLSQLRCQALRLKQNASISLGFSPFP